MTTYSAGTISVGANGTTVTGVGTAWNTSGIRAGDRLICAGLVGIIASVNSNTSLTLKRGWAGSAQSGANYDIELVDDNVRSLVSANALLQALQGNGTLTSLGALAGAADQMPYFTGAGVMGTTSLTAIGRALIGSNLLGVSGVNLTTPNGTRLTGGAVMENATDITVGRLVRTRDFGLGTAIALLAENNLDDIVRAGFYYNGTGSNTTGNNYPTTTAGALLVLGFDANRCTQIYSTYATNTLATGSRTFVRSRGNSGWTAWSEVFHQGSILGAVSQVGGVPSGKVIERGSNANGEFVKFADGTMICTHTGPALATETLANGLYVSELTGWTFPAAFAAPPAVSGIASDATKWLGMSGATNTATSYRQIRGASSASATVARIMAIGRWF